MPRTSEPTSKNLETFRLIETLLLWEGVARNERVRELLGLHYVSTSRLLSQYESLNSEGLSYSNGIRGYVTGSTFKPIFTNGRVEEYMAVLSKDARHGDHVARTHMDFGTVDRHAFSLLHRAAREKLSVTAKHCSMRHPEPVLKTFFPHTLVEAGRRWHVRAYVLNTEGSGAFQDLALTRLSSVELKDEPRPAKADSDNDQAWSKILDVRIIPHPLLTPEQKKMIRMEYFNGTSARRVNVRAALLHYTLHELRVAISPEKQLPPDYQLCVDNVASIKEWLMPNLLQVG